MKKGRMKAAGIFRIFYALACGACAAFGGFLIFIGFVMQAGTNEIADNVGGGNLAEALVGGWAAALGATLSILMFILGGVILVVGFVLFLVNLITAIKCVKKSKLDPATFARVKGGSIGIEVWYLLQTAIFLGLGVYQVMGTNLAEISENTGAIICFIIGGFIFLTCLLSLADVRKNKVQLQKLEEQTAYNKINN